MKGGGRGWEMRERTREGRIWCGTEDGVDGRNINSTKAKKCTRTQSRKHIDALLTYSLLLVYPTMHIYEMLYLCERWRAAAAPTTTLYHNHPYTYTHAHNTYVHSSAPKYNNSNNLLKNHAVPVWTVESSCSTHLHTMRSVTCLEFSRASRRVPGRVARRAVACTARAGVQWMDGWVRCDGAKM